MNNSFARLIDGMIDTLRFEVIPHTEGEFARGQAFGVIFMLKSLRLRADWSPAFLDPQLDALADLAHALSQIEGLPAEAYAPLQTGPHDGTPEQALALRDAADRSVCDLIDWLYANETLLPVQVAAATRRAIKAYITRQLRHEIATSAKPMFAEISLGREIDEKETG